jgi:hypothetical protein
MCRLNARRISKLLVSGVGRGVFATGWGFFLNNMRGLRCSGRLMSMVSHHRQFPYLRIILRRFRDINLPPME